MSILKKLIAFAAHSQLSKLDDLYQRHAGQECYIFGNGISLKWMDLHQFADRPSILGNMLIFHKEANALIKPYCSIIEPTWFYPFYPYLGHGKLQIFRNYVNKEYKKSIIENPETLFLINIANYPVARFSNVLFVSRWYKSPFKNNNPFMDCTDACQGTLSFQLSLSIYLGFKRAYLIGHDYTHFPSRTHHFYEKGAGILDGNRSFSREFIDYAKQHIDLVTVTLDGGSETMNSITYRNLTGKEPSFRENIDIVERVKLESLATWKGYSIF
jgi:hypothetical protein